MPGKPAPFTKTENALHRQREALARVAERSYSRQQLPLQSHVHPGLSVAQWKGPSQPLSRGSLRAGVLGKTGEGGPSTRSFSTCGSPSRHSEPKSVAASLGPAFVSCKRRSSPLCRPFLLLLTSPPQFLLNKLSLSPCQAHLLTYLGRCYDEFPFYRWGN